MGKYWFRAGRPLRRGIATVCLAAFLVSDSRVGPHTLRPRLDLVPLLPDSPSFSPAVTAALHFLQLHCSTSFDMLIDLIVLWLRSRCLFGYSPDGRLARPVQSSRMSPASLEILRTDLGQNDTQTGALVSCYCLGALGGCILNFYTGDRLGRRKSMWLAMVGLPTS